MQSRLRRNDRKFHQTISEPSPKILETLRNRNYAREQSGALKRLSRSDKDENTAKSNIQGVGLRLAKIKYPNRADRQL